MKNLSENKQALTKKQPSKGDSICYQFIRHVSLKKKTVILSYSLILTGLPLALKNDGEQFPAASAMKDVSLEKVAKELDADTTNAFVSMVSVDVAEYAKTHFEKSVRKTLTIPAWLNIAAQQKNINFSQTLQEALLAKIKACGHFIFSSY